MKQSGFILVLLFLFWQLTIPAAAQNPYHCDSLKVTCFDETKINIRYFNTEKSCPATCKFCEAISKQDWLKVNNQLKQETKTLRLLPEKLPELRTWLLTHRLVNFVLPPEIETKPKQIASTQIGFQVPHMTLTWNATFKLKKARKEKPAAWAFSEIKEYPQIYRQLNEMGANFQRFLKSDTLHLPQPLLPDQNYLASWFGTRNLTPAEYAALENQIRTRPRETIKMFTENKDGFGLALMMAHQSLAIRYLALQGIKTIQDKNCLPFLLRVAEATIHAKENSPEVDVLFSNYCEQLVSTIGILTNCSFNRCPYAHYGPQHYLRLGLPTWERKIEHRNSQGIGSYGMLL